MYNFYFILHVLFNYAYILLGVEIMRKFIFFIFLFYIFSFSILVSAQEELIPNATSGILMEINSGKIIFEREKDKEVSIASLTKMVAQIIILEEIEKGSIKWDDMVTVSKNASDMGGSQIYLEQGEKMSVEDLMKGISVASGNDAVVAMAEFISGTEEKFVKRMNRTVRKLGLKHTRFSNCTGLDEENHYSSAYDMAMIARELIMNHSEILRFSSIYEDYLRENTDRKFWLVNTNKLVSQYEGCDGLKTGHTDNAGYCLAATSKRDNVRLIGIVLGEKDSKVRNSETINLLDYGFNNVKVNVLKRKGSIIDYLSLEKANIKNVPILLKNDLIVIDGPSNKKEIKYKVQFNNYNLPIKKKTVIGNIKAFYKKNLISEEDLIIGESIRKIDYFDLLKEQLINLLLGNI